MCPSQLVRPRFRASLPKFVKSGVEIIATWLWGFISEQVWRNLVVIFLRRDSGRPGPQTPKTQEPRETTLLLLTNKTHTGHLEGGAAMTTLIAAVLQVKSGCSSAINHLRVLNPNLEQAHSMAVVGQSPVLGRQSSLVARRPSSLVGRRSSLVGHRSPVVTGPAALGAAGASAGGGAPPDPGPCAIAAGALHLLVARNSEQPHLPRFFVQPGIVVPVLTTVSALEI